MKSVFFKKPLAVCLLIFYGGCTQYSSQRQPSEELHLYVDPEPVSLDPRLRLGESFTSQAIIYQLFEGLTHSGTEGEPEPAIAQAIDISNDRTTYTFHPMTVRKPAHH